MKLTTRIKAAWDALTYREPSNYRATQWWLGGRPYNPGAVQSARLDISKATRHELVRQSRIWEQESPLVNRLASIFESYVTGQGLVVQPRSDDPDWNIRAAESWEDWGNYCDLTTRQPLASLQSMWARGWFVDGEVFILKVDGESGRARIQTVGAELVQSPNKAPESTFDGIQFDPRGRPTGYWIGEEKTDGRVDNVMLRPADKVIHLFEPDRPRQARGIPFITPALNTLSDIDSLQLLEMQAARDAAAVTNVLTNEAGEMSAADLRRLSFTQTRELKSGSTADETRYEAFKDITGGRMIALKNGEKMEQFRSERPSVVTMDYWHLLESKVCQACGIPYVLANPDSMQGTVYRGALDMAAAYFRARSLIVASVLQELWRYFITRERAFNPSIRDLPGNWQRVAILPPRAVNVDIGRNATAMKIELDYGATTLAEVYGARGQDWKQALRQRSEEKAFADSLGLSLTAAAPNQPQPTEPTPA